ncbi:PHD finger protein 3 isoform 2-T2 [Discoglossus pictus]
MDIVDTFNHLIPTEHLDDALFLGTNLESEGCDEFSTNQHVIEDSLKNMLSDKDPMLGSASTQFCLPVLDNTDPNFQLSSTPGVGLDDIMDVSIVKETTSDLNDEEDLILPSKNAETLSKSIRKSPRFVAQESGRSLRQSTVEKRLNPVPVSSPKKAKSSRKDAGDQLKEQDNILPSKSEQENDEKINKMSGQIEEINISCVNSRRSTRLASKELKEKIDDKNITLKLTVGETPGEMHNDILTNMQSVLEKVNQSETEHVNPCVVSNESAAEMNKEIASQNKLTLEGGDCTVAELANKATEETIFDNDVDNSTAKKTDVIYETVHKELALLSGAAEPNLGDNGQLHSAVKREPPMETLDYGTVEEAIDIEKSVNISELDLNDSSGTRCEAVELGIQKSQGALQDENKGQITDHEMSQMGEGCSKQSHGKKASKKVRSKAAKSRLKKPAGTHEKLVAKKHTNVNSKSSVKSSKSLSSEPNLRLSIQPRQKVVKMKKKLTEKTKNDKEDSKNKILKKVCSVEKKGHQTHSDPNLKQICDIPRESQGSLKEAPYPQSARSQARSLSHSSEKTVSKQMQNETGEQKETIDHSEEKSKLKKSLQPRQRRSSKSISVDEPQLFIPDNIPSVKKEGTDVTSPSDKPVLNPMKHCCSCRKLHGNRFMVGCGRCDDWFHGDCVGLSLSQAQQMEAEDREYICVKCCLEEEKVEVTDSTSSNNLQKIDVHQEIKVVESDKQMVKSLAAGTSSLSHEKSKQMDDKHKVKIFRKDSADGKHLPEIKDVEIKTHTFYRKNVKSTTESHRISEEKHEKVLKDSTSAPCHDEKASKSGLNERQEIKKKKPERKGSSSSSNLHPSTPPTPKPSVDQIRQSVRHSLKDILIKRLSESSSKIPEERATKVSSRIERELFSFYRDTDSKYKNKYRSLMFNLKDPKNNVLFKRVLKGEITPEHLIKMSPEELASRELAAWRQRENRHTIEMIEKEQREVERRPITKITHKGEIEIETEAPMKEPEAMDNEEPVVKPVEKEEEIQKDKDVSEEPTSDTTTQHKNHLFDLNCKICTGRMAPPAEDLSPKKVKVSTGISRKQSDNGMENISEALSSSSSILNIDVLETERQESPKDIFSSAASTELFNITDTAEDESSFLGRMTYIWKGFLNMPSVAKFLIKAYPVSGSLENLTEDLPESIQVGGRISPQTVWDYVDKIKASGTKETCVIRFCPATEEDQISYTLLYSYFSSRKRYGVVANNMRQVKDMYLIPLGASEKIPHFFVPFDGPGLEAHRPNLLLALIIRQKMKRLHSTSLDEESAGLIVSIPTEKKSRLEVANEDEEEDDENDFFNSFTAVLHKNRNRPTLSDTDEPQTPVESVPEIIKREPPKPLRFLPGVLVGWENAQSTLDLASKPLPVDDILQSLLGTTENAYEHKKSTIVLHNVEKSLVEEKNNLKEEIVISKAVPNDTTLEIETSPEDMEKTAENLSSLTQSPPGNLPGLSLKGKPPDVSTEAFLTNVNVQSNDEGGLLDEPGDAKYEKEIKTNPISSPVLGNVTKETQSIDDDNLSPSEKSAIFSKNQKLINMKRDPRQAAGRSLQDNLSDIKDHDLNKNEDSIFKDTDVGSPSLHKRDKIIKQFSDEKDSPIYKSDKSKCGLKYTSHVENEKEHSEKLKHTDSKSFSQGLLIDDTDPLQQLRRALAANKSQAQTSNALHSDTSSKSPISTFGGNFSSIRLQQPQFLPLKGTTTAFPFQQNPSYPLQGNPMFPYNSHIPPLLPTPLGIGFPRPPRFHSAETVLHNPLIPWHPPVQLSSQSQHYLGPAGPGPLLVHDQVRYQGPQKFYQKDHRAPERRHSDPWDKPDRLSDKTFTRGSRGDFRKRLYSESHHSRDKRQYDKESGNDKHGDKDSERSRRRDREKERSHDRERKSRDESQREKERSRSSHGDKSSDSKTHKEGRNTDKSKGEERGHDKDKHRDRNRDKEDEKDRERHHKERDRDHSDKMKSKR